MTQVSDTARFIFEAARAAVPSVEEANVRAIVYETLLELDAAVTRRIVLRDDPIDLCSLAAEIGPIK